MHQTHVEHLIKTYHIGGIIFLGMGIPEQHYQSLSTTPLLIGQDLEWGLSMRLHNTLRFPHNMTLGALQDNTLIYTMGYEIGLQARFEGTH